MKNIVLAMVLAVSVTWIVGCKKEEAPSATVVAPPDTTQVRAAFDSADPTVKGELDVALSLVKAGDYTGGLRKLEALAANIKLTPQQQTAVKNYVAQLQANAGTALRNATGGISNAASGATDAARQVGGDLQKSLGK